MDFSFAWVGDAWSWWTANRLTAATTAVVAAAAVVIGWSERSRAKTAASALSEDRLRELHKEGLLLAARVRGNLSEDSGGRTLTITNEGPFPISRPTVDWLTELRVTRRNADGEIEEMRREPAGHSISTPGLSANQSVPFQAPTDGDVWQVTFTNYLGQHWVSHMGVDTYRVSQRTDPFEFVNPASGAASAKKHRRGLRSSASD